MERTEGVIKFAARHRAAELEAARYGELACTLIAWREVLAKTRLVGQDPTLYDGAGYGNVSARVGPPSAPRGQRSFLITGTQTGGCACVSLGEFCVVERYDYRRNAVESHGPIAPSSESMTHGAIYDLGPHVRCVLHGHSPTIWRRAKALRLPTSDPRVAYGTPEMASEVERLHRSSPLAELRILAMGGHEDGVVVFGKSPEDAGQVLVSFLARAYALECGERGGGLCGV
ncbi:MAG: class II aldolase/adducin family protein [Deltaproteobacteria bacterium]|nr:class II aldolase/adducin family protein [Deltaproteobacteria bacterium]